MQKSVILWSVTICLMLSGSALAQLPANPWGAAKSAEGGVAKISDTTTRQYIPSIKYAPVNADSQAPVYKAAIDSAGVSKAAATTTSNNVVAVKAAAPSPAAPSMAKAIDLYISKVKSGEEVAVVELHNDEAKEEFIRTQQSKLAKKGRTRHSSTEKK